MLPRFRGCAVINMIKASPKDARTLADTRRIVWEETYRGIYLDSILDGYDVEYYTARDRQRMEDPNHVYYLFMDGKNCVGYFSFGPYNYGTYKDFALCLNNLYILKSHKGRGLGRQAFQVIRQYCRDRKIHRFFCGCNANNLPAVAFYRHMGGIQGDEVPVDVPPQDQIIHFEFYLGE